MKEFALACRRLGAIALALWAGGLAPAVAQGQTNWFPHPTGVPVNLLGVNFAQDQFVAIGEKSTLLTSPDGVVWTFCDPGPNRWLLGVGYGAGLHVAVGYSGVLLTSTNGVAWTNQVSGVTNFLYDVAYGAGTLVVVGDEGVVLTSPEGTHWVRQSSATVNQLDGVAYADGRFVAVGYNGAIVTSTNALQWERAPGTRTRWLTDVAWGEGRWVAVGYGGTILTSTNGLDWAERPSPTTLHLQAVAYGADRFVAVGASGAIVSSPDGLVWTAEPSGTPNYLLGVAEGAGEFVIVGAAGVVLSSNPGTTPTSLYLSAPRLLAEGRFAFEIVGLTWGQQAAVEATSNPGEGAWWETVGTVVGTGNPLTFVDANTGQNPVRFYRLRSPPSPPTLDIQLTVPRLLADGRFAFDISGLSAGQAATVEARGGWDASAPWAVIGGVVGSTNAVTFVDPNTAQNPIRFYRVRSP